MGIGFAPAARLPLSSLSRLPDSQDTTRLQYLLAKTIEITFKRTMLHFSLSLNCAANSWSFLRIERVGKEGDGVESTQRINPVILVNDPPLSQTILSQQQGSAEIEKLFFWQVNKTHPNYVERNLAGFEVKEIVNVLARWNGHWFVSLPLHCC